MKSINIRTRSQKRISKFGIHRSKQIYFTSQRKLLEMERDLREKSQDRKQATKQSGFNMKKMMIFGMIMTFLALLALGGCSSTQNADSSSYGKSKSGYEKGRSGSSGGYY
jgi:hypothetical protein